MVYISPHVNLTLNKTTQDDLSRLTTMSGVQYGGDSGFVYLGVFASGAIIFLDAIGRIRIDFTHQKTDGVTLLRNSAGGNRATYPAGGHAKCPSDILWIWGR